MTQYHDTLRGKVRRKTHVRGLPMHPIERNPAYQEYLNQVGAQDSTRYALQRMLRALVPCTLPELTHNNIDGAVQKLVADGYNINSVDRYLRILKAFLSWCNARGKVPTNAAIDVKSPEDPECHKTMPKLIENDYRKALDDYYKAGTAEQQFFWACIKGGSRISEPAMAVAGDVELHNEKTGLRAYVWLGSKSRKKGKRLVDLPMWVTPAVLALLEAAQGDASYPLMYLDGVKVVYPKRGVKENTMRNRATKARNAFYEVQKKLFGHTVACPKSFRSDYTTRVLSENPNDFMVEKLAQRNGHNPEVLRSDYAHLLKHGPDISDV